MTTKTPRTARSRRVCLYCHRRATGLMLGCERCGAEFHQQCHLKRLPVGERFTLEATDQPYSFVCHPCRS